MLPRVADQDSSWLSERAKPSRGTEPQERDASVFSWAILLGLKFYFFALVYASAGASHCQCLLHPPPLALGCLALTCLRLAALQLARRPRTLAGEPS